MWFIIGLIYINKNSGSNTDLCCAPLLRCISSLSILRLISLYVSIIIFRVFFYRLLLWVSINCYRRFQSSVSKALEMSSAIKYLSPFFFAMYDTNWSYVFWWFNSFFCFNRIMHVPCINRFHVLLEIGISRIYLAHSAVS